MTTTTTNTPNITITTITTSITTAANVSNPGINALNRSMVGDRLLTSGFELCYV